MGESWYGTDSKVWFVVSMILSVTIVAVGVLAGCEAAGSSPEHPIYTECEK